MAKQFAALWVLAVLLTGLAGAQDQSEERVFNLQVGEKPLEDQVQDQVEKVKYKPALEGSKLDLSLTLGYFLMDKTLLKHDYIIYLATDEFFYYGKMELQNEKGFNPIMRLSYSLTPWFALEAQTGITFAKYKGTITEPRRINPWLENPLPEVVAQVGQFDPESRSCLIWISNINGVWYPLSTGGKGSGRFHPYLTGGFGHALYNMDSNYTDDPANGFNVNAGFGIKMIADKRISLRAEVLYQHHKVEFTPAEYFDVRDRETVKVPVYDFEPYSGSFKRVAAYEANSLGGLTIQLGFSAIF